MMDATLFMVAAGFLALIGFEAERVLGVKQVPVRQQVRTNR